MQTNRFIVRKTEENKYRVRDMLNGRDLRFSFGEPVYGTDLKPADDWNNFYSARCFADRMSAANEKLNWSIEVPDVA